jgi:hypothetical protein
MLLNLLTMSMMVGIIQAVSFEWVSHKTGGDQLIVEPTAIRKQSTKGACAAIPAINGDAHVAQTGALQCASQVEKALSQFRSCLCLRLLCNGAVVIRACAFGVSLLTQDPDAMRLVDAVLGTVPWDANRVITHAVDAVQGETAVPMVAQLHHPAQVHFALQNDAFVVGLARCIARRRSEVDAATSQSSRSTAESVPPDFSSI